MNDPLQIPDREPHQGQEHKQYSGNPDEKSLAAMAHFFNFLVFLIAPLVIWITNKDKHAFVDKHGREAVNFSISVVLYSIILMVVMAVFVAAGASGMAVGDPVASVVSIVLMFGAISIYSIFVIVVTIIAGVRAMNGQEYRYPLTIRFIR